ncbi:MAG TPA: peptidyl-prolyl cis-trans isomerase [Candidatus Acidoferrales bacterium]|nr:peptidyl-prolyl cis-trans isomerase [Candidatus Acidoferrales bacterium]
MTRRSVNFWQENDRMAVRLMIGLAILLAGCSRHQENGRRLASVNNSSLYVKDIASHVDTNSAYAVRNYVSNWVSQQLLFDAAKKEGLDNAPEFQESVAEYTRQLAITMLLNRKVYEVPIQLSEDEISNYYNSHRDELRANNEIVCVNLAAFDKRSRAVSFRNALVSGSSWNDVFNDIPTNAIVDVKDSVYITSSSVHPAIWNVIQSLETRRISFPIQVDTLSYVVQVIKKFGVGDLLPIDYASPHIRERLTIEKRRQRYHLLLDSLRSAGNFQIDPSVAIRDTNVEE